MRYLTIDEIQCLLSVVDKEYLRVIIIIALGTGMRKGEILNVKWKDINLDEGYIQVGVDGMNTKSGKVRIIPIDDYVTEVLSKWHSDSEYVFKVKDFRKAFN